MVIAIIILLIKTIDFRLLFTILGISFDLLIIVVCLVYEVSHYIL